MRKRSHSAILRQHLLENRQMAFVSGPRQVGKTTVCQQLSDVYLDWDDDDDRELILSGTQAVSQRLELDQMRNKPIVVVFDELHKYHRWKRFLKGFFDKHSDSCRMIVTGSSRLDVFTKGGDSLMGRYFLYRMHPLSVSELLLPTLRDDLVVQPVEPKEKEFNTLWEHGGFPEPFIKNNKRFSNRWRGLRNKQLFAEDVRELTSIQELSILETFGRLLTQRSGEQIVFSNMARTLRVSVNTVRSWLATLESLHYGFVVRPWFNNITRSLRKEPKWFVRDWSVVDDVGQRAETFVANHLLKAVEGWTDQGYGEFSLHYVRDKEKREVDLLVVRDQKPWILVEVKHKSTVLSPHLETFQKQLGCPHAFQVVLELEYVQGDCFSQRGPIVVPARTLLAQIL